MQNPTQVQNAEKELSLILNNGFVGFSIGSLSSLAIGVFWRSNDSATNVDLKKVGRAFSSAGRNCRPPDSKTG